MFLEPLELQQKVYDHYVYEANLVQPRLLHGIVRGVVELGSIYCTPRASYEEQVKQTDYIKGKTSALEELEEIISGKFSESYGVRKLKQYVLVVEFPDITVDPDKILYGVSNPKPLRLANCGIYHKTSMSTVYHPMRAGYCKFKTEDKLKFSMDTNCSLYKMLLNRKLIKEGKRVLHQQLGRLLDESFMFDVQLWHHNSVKINSKVLFNNDCKLDHPVTSKSGFYIGFNTENNLDALKSLDLHVVNSIKQSMYYSGSMIEQQINMLEKAYTASNVCATI